jgi:hypothetical protein
MRQAQVAEAEVQLGLDDALEVVDAAHVQLAHIRDGLQLRVRQPARRLDLLEVLQVVEDAADLLQEPQAGAWPLRLVLHPYLVRSWARHMCASTGLYGTSMLVLGALKVAGRYHLKQGTLPASTLSPSQREAPGLRTDDGCMHLAKRCLPAHDCSCHDHRLQYVGKHTTSPPHSASATRLVWLSMKRVANTSGHGLRHIAHSVFF